MTRFATALLALALLVSLLVVACLDDDDDGASRGDFTVGALLPLTGDLASYGESSNAALEEAVSNFEEDGWNITLSVEDTRSDPAGALDGLTSLHDEGVRLVIGPYSSSEVREVKDFADENGIILISPLSTAGSLAVPDDNVLRFTPGEELEGIAVANLAWTDGIRSIVPITRDDPGNQGLQLGMKPAFEALGGTVGPLIEYAPDDEDFTDEVQKLLDQLSSAPEGSGPTAIYLTAFAEVVGLFEAASVSPELQSVPWYGSDSVAQIRELIDNETAAEFAVTTGYPNPILGLREEDRASWEPVNERLTESLGHAPDTFALAAYDALNVSVEALHESGSDADAASLRQGVEDVAGNYIGLTGPTTLDGAGDRSIGNFDFWAVCEEGTSYTWI
jgi:branched-chain amino acid transport system substrate-binding protein